MSDNPHDEPRCIRCGEDGFPVKADAWAMGTLRHLGNASKKVQRKAGWAGPKEDMRSPYLCGNCYFDLTD